MVLLFTKVYNTSKLGNYGTFINYGKSMVLLTKLWYYEQNYTTIDQTIVLYQEIRNSDLRRKRKHGRLSRTKTL